VAESASSRYRWWVKEDELKGISDDVESVPLLNRGCRRSTTRRTVTARGAQRGL
jgi:hypothetical protein